MNNERYKQLMNDVGLPNSLSLLTALRQVENEVSQPLLAEIANLRAANDMLTKLLYAVGKKYPDETRHETALRYIRQAEAPQNDMCKDEALEQKP